jgi:hypothetical protein
VDPVAVVAGPPVQRARIVLLGHEGVETKEIERFGVDCDIVRAEGRPYRLVRVGKRVEPLHPIVTSST